MLGLEGKVLRKLSSITEHLESREKLCDVGENMAAAGRVTFLALTSLKPRLLVLGCKGHMVISSGPSDATRLRGTARCDVVFWAGKEQQTCKQEVNRPFLCPSSCYLTSLGRDIRRPGASSEPPPPHILLVSSSFPYFNFLSPHLLTFSLSIFKSPSCLLYPLLLPHFLYIIFILCSFTTFKWFFSLLVILIVFLVL